jgi:hypothetical protein
VKRGKTKNGTAPPGFAAGRDKCQGNEYCQTYVIAIVGFNISKFFDYFSENSITRVRNMISIFIVNSMSI